MKITLSFDSTTGQHTHMTIFVNGRNTGKLCMSPDEADWFNIVLEQGCELLTLPTDGPTKGLQFSTVGSHRPDQPIPKIPAHV